MLPAAKPSPRFSLQLSWAIVNREDREDLSFLCASQRPVCQILTVEVQYTLFLFFFLLSCAASEMDVKAGEQTKVTAGKAARCSTCGTDVQFMIFSFRL